MNSLRQRRSAAVIVAFFAAGLLVVGALRYMDVHLTDPPSVARYATLLYIALTVVVSILLIRTDVPMRRLGFGLPFRPLRYLALALAGVAVLQLASWWLTPLLEHLFGVGRDLSRFEEATTSTSELAKLLLLSWTVAAFGEELAFRIVLMRGVAFALGDGRRDHALALLVQALVFAAVHAYQGPAGIAGTAVSGLVYGALTLASRGSIWPAALAHGLGNTVGILRLYAH